MLVHGQPPKVPQNYQLRVSTSVWLQESLLQVCWISLDAPVSRYQSPERLIPQFSNGSKKSHWFLVCTAFFCCCNALHVRAETESFESHLEFKIWNLDVHISIGKSLVLSHYIYIYIFPVYTCTSKIIHLLYSYVYLAFTFILMSVSCRQHIFRSLFYLVRQSLPFNWNVYVICFNIITKMIDFKSITLLFMVYFIPLDLLN